MALTERTEFQRRLGTPNDNGELLLDIRDGTIPNFLPDLCYAVVGNTATVIRPPVGALVVGLSVEVESFTLRTGDQIARSITGGGSDELTIVSHGYIDGDGPFLVTSDDSLPPGLVSGTQYFVNSVTASTVSLHLTRAAAEVGTDAISITGAGAGTRTLGGFALEAVASEQSVGDNIITLNAGNGKGSSQILPVFMAFRSRPLTVKGETAASILKYAFA